jgi:hypothetical protein
MAIYWGRNGGRQGLFSCGARCFEQVSKGHVYACLQCSAAAGGGGAVCAAAGLNYRVAESRTDLLVIFGIDAQMFEAVSDVTGGSGGEAV